MSIILTCVYVLIMSINIDKHIIYLNGINIYYINYFVLISIYCVYNFSLTELYTDYKIYLI